jgi:ribosomal protein S27AE
MQESGFLVKIDRAGDLIYWTYYMIDWGKIKQSESDQKCIRCGGEMASIGPVEDPDGKRYRGLVCHNCKQVIWARQT